MILFVRVNYAMRVAAAARPFHPRGAPSGVQARDHCPLPKWLA
jgi:hypothetical protein